MSDFCRGRTRKQKIIPPPGSKRLAQTRSLHSFFAWENKEEEKRGEVFTLPFHKRKKPNTATGCLQKESKQAQADDGFFYYSIFIVQFSGTREIVYKPFRLNIKFIPFSAFWLRSSVVSVLISLISDTRLIEPHDINLIFLGDEAVW